MPHQGCALRPDPLQVALVRGPVQPTLAVGIEHLKDLPHLGPQLAPTLLLLLLLRMLLLLLLLGVGAARGPR
jgi:hypothetical protein